MAAAGPVYATLEDLTALAVNASALEALAPDRINRGLRAASRIADSYLGARFTLPIVAWDDDLTQRVAAIGTWMLMSGRGMNPDNPADTALRDNYKDAIKWLEGVRDGVNTPVSIQDSTPNRPGVGGFVAIPTSNESRGYSSAGSLFQGRLPFVGR